VIVQLRATFTARNGIITQAEFDLGDTYQEIHGQTNESLINRKLHEIKSWASLLPNPEVGQFMDDLFGLGKLSTPDKGCWTNI
jgi:hypothetical protein